VTEACSPGRVRNSAGKSPASAAAREVSAVTSIQPVRQPEARSAMQSAISAPTPAPTKTCAASANGAFDAASFAAGRMPIRTPVTAM
jgi:hypothetical protein